MLDISGIMELLVRNKSILQSDRWTGEKYVYSLADRLCSLPFVAFIERVHCGKERRGSVCAVVSSLWTETASFPYL